MSDDAPQPRGYEISRARRGDDVNWQAAVLTELRRIADINEIMLSTLLEIAERLPRDQPKP